MKLDRRASRLSALAATSWLGALCLGACSGDDEDTDSFDIRTTPHGHNGATPLVVRGNWAAYFADETTTGTGTILNEDGKQDGDQVVVGLRLNKKRTFEIGVAAQFVDIVRGNFYLVVDEAIDPDERDWDGSPADNLVLLRWKNGFDEPEFIDLIDREAGAVPILAQEGRLYYSTLPSALSMPDETTLRFLGQGSLSTPRAVFNEVGAGQRVVRILGQEPSDASLLLLYMDETAEVAAGHANPDLNGDGDMADEVVLAILDARQAANPLHNIGVALDSVDSPVEFRRRESVTDFLIAFLVPEMAQADSMMPLSFNDPADFAMPLLPPGCGMVADTDLDDEVLHYVYFNDFVNGLDTVRNTGITGRDRIVIAGSRVATITEEADVGCDLNGDMDMSDRIPRWVEALRGGAILEPVVDPVQMMPVTGVRGGSFGLAPLGNRLVGILSEADAGTDLDGLPGQRDLLSWIDPRGTQPWRVQHEIGQQAGAQPFIGVSWLDEDTFNGRLAIGFSEEFVGLSLNADCRPLSEADGDTTDSLPNWLRFGEDNNRLFVRGVGVALEPSNEGLFLARGHAFYRVSESEDERDHNLDGDRTDVLLMRSPFSGCRSRTMDFVANLPGPAIVTDRNQGALYLASEVGGGLDLNRDGDANDLVVRYFSF